MLIRLATPLVGLFIATAAGAQTTAPAALGQQISRVGCPRSLAGPAEFFTGRVGIDPVYAANDSIPPMRSSGGAASS